MSEEQLAKDIKWAHAIYLLQAIGLAVGITFFIAVILAYIKRGEVRDSWLATHFRWQIKTFWIWFILSVVGTLLSIILIGWFVLLGVYIWAIYRVVTGWVYLSDGKPMAN